MSVADNRGTVRDRLRAAAAVDAHAALEAALDLATQLRKRADLAAVLARFRGFFRPLETALDTPIGPRVMTCRHRKSALEADLSSLWLARAALADAPATAPSWPDFVRAPEKVADPVAAEHGAQATFARLRARMTAPRTAAG